MARHTRPLLPLDEEAAPSDDAEALLDEDDARRVNDCATCSAPAY